MSKQFLIICNIILGVFAFIISQIAAENDVRDIAGIMGILQLTYAFWSWIKLTKSILNPYLLFLLTAYIFTFGQSILYVFDSVDEKIDIINFLDLRLILMAQPVTLLFLSFFHTGAMYAFKGRSRKHILTDRQQAAQLTAIRKAGWILFAISVVPFSIDTFRQIFLSVNFGYGELYEQDIKVGVDNIIAVLAQYFMPSLICLFVGYYQSRKARLLLYILFGLFVASTMIVGGRTMGVIMIVVVLLLRHHLIKPIRFKQMVVYGCGLFLFIGFLSVVSDQRSKSGSERQGYVDAFMGQKNKGNLFLKSINEMGGSMYPLGATMELVPERYPYRYGLSYFYSMTSVIPNMGFWPVHPAMKHGNLGEWLMKAQGLGYGPGYSIVAEAYINFGYFGFLMMFVLGAFFSRIFSYVERFESTHNFLNFLLAILFCYLSLGIVRNSFLTVIRSLAYFMLPIWAYVTYYTKRHAR